MNLELTISSTSYSDSSSIITGGGGGCNWPGRGSEVAGFNRETWKTGCTFIEARSSSLYVWEDTFLVILNFPRHLKSSLEDGQVVFRFFRSSHTSSLTSNFGAGILCLSAYSEYTAWAQVISFRRYSLREAKFSANSFRTVSVMGASGRHLVPGASTLDMCGD